jgi:hypothetical protein
VFEFIVEVLPLNAVIMAEVDAAALLPLTLKTRSVKVCGIELNAI